MRKPGDRIGAMLSMKDGIYKLLGYGIYVGDECPFEAVGSIAETVIEIGLTNPKLLLDNGTVVYGCECWWGDERTVKNRLEGKRVVNVNINDVRKGHRHESHKE